MWKAAGISGLPGHRSVGGYRASVQCITARKCSGFSRCDAELERNV
jgi:hypothetical protein